MWERCGTIPLKQTPVPCAIPSCHVTISSSGPLDRGLWERDWPCKSLADTTSNPTSSVVIGGKPDLFPFLFFFFTVHTYFILKQKNSSRKEGQLKPPAPPPPSPGSAVLEFLIPSIDKWHPFHVPSLELCTRFNFCKCTAFVIWITVFSTFSQTLNAYVTSFGPFTNRNDRFSYPLIYFN